MGPFIRSDESYYFDLSHQGPHSMSLQPHRPIPDAPAESLRELDSNTGPETPNMRSMKRILLQRIAETEATQRGKRAS